MNLTGVKKHLSKTINSLTSNKIINSDLLYKIVVVLAILNMISYIVSKNINAVAIFTLIYLATNCITKNITIVLITAIFATNFFVVGKKIKENMENPDATTGGKADPITEPISNFKDDSGNNGEEGYDNIDVELQPKDIAPVEFNQDSAELAKQLKILNERTKSSMGMINKMGGIGNIGKMIESLTGIVNKLN
jgi:hypothetical protein